MRPTLIWTMKGAAAWRDYRADARANAAIRTILEGIDELLTDYGWWCGG